MRPSGSPYIICAYLFAVIQNFFAVWLFSSSPVVFFFFFFFFFFNFLVSIFLSEYANASVNNETKNSDTNVLMKELVPDAVVFFLADSYATMPKK